MKGFTARQLRFLKSELPSAHIHTRHRDGREYPFISGWYAIQEANRIFGAAGWDRETLETRNVLNRESRGTFLAVYIARVRIRVRANGHEVLREGHGSGEAKASSPGEAHDIALKSAETDATKRALATFGHPFGLGLYLGKRGDLRQSAGSGTTAADVSKPSSAPAATTNSEKPSVEETADASRNPVGQNRTRADEPIDKSVLSIGAPRRYRDKTHLRFVAAQPCLLCGRSPSDAHHVRFAQPQALGRKVSDEYTVPLCRLHHRRVHQAGNEAAFWDELKIDVLGIAGKLWRISRAAKSDFDQQTGAPASEQFQSNPGVDDVPFHEPEEADEATSTELSGQIATGKAVNGRDRTG